MAHIDMRRVVLGGLVAAVIVNAFEAAFAFFMRSEREPAIQRLGIRPAPGPASEPPLAGPALCRAREPEGVSSSARNRR